MWGQALKLTFKFFYPPLKIRRVGEKNTQIFPTRRHLEARNLVMAQRIDDYLSSTIICSDVMKVAKICIRQMQISAYKIVRMRIETQMLLYRPIRHENWK